MLRYNNVTMYYTRSKTMLLLQWVTESPCGCVSPLYYFSVLEPQLCSALYHAVTQNL